MDVLYQGPCGKRNDLVPAVTACTHTSLPLGVRQDLVIGAPESGYIWRASSPQSASPKVGQSRSIRVLYTLGLELSLLGHERVLVEEASRRYVCDCQG